MTAGSGVRRISSDTTFVSKWLRTNVDQNGARAAFDDQISYPTEP